MAIDLDAIVVNVNRPLGVADYNAIQASPSGANQFECGGPRAIS
jgi:hypothetical protein